MGNEALIGRGLTSEVFTWGDGRVLKLFFPWVQAPAVKREFEATHLIHAAGLPVPAVFEMVQVGDRYAIVFERIQGESLLRRAEKKPWTIFSAARQTAELHAGVHACEASAALQTQREQLERWIRSPVDFPPDRRADALAQVARLPAGDSLCHGDFHPANILLTERGPVIIDWSTASRGSALADLARTSVLFEGADLPPHAAWHAHVLLKVARRALHATYLRRYLQLRPATRTELETCRCVQRLAGKRGGRQMLKR